jgi:hypothetical protein
MEIKWFILMMKEMVYGKNANTVNNITKTDSFKPNTMNKDTFLNSWSGELAIESSMSDIDAKKFLFDFYEKVVRFEASLSSGGVSEEERLKDPNYWEALFNRIDRPTTISEGEIIPIKDIQNLLSVYEQSADKTASELKEVKATMFVNFGGGNDRNPKLIESSEVSALKMFMLIMEHYHPALSQSSKPITEGSESAIFNILQDKFPDYNVPYCTEVAKVIKELGEKGGEG